MLPTYELPMPSSSDGDEAIKNVFFVAGFPDDQTSAWGNFLEKIQQSKKYENSKIICLCLPEFDKTNKTSQHRKWGYSFQKIVDKLTNTINFYVPDQSKKVELIVHDFGAWVGLCYAAKNSDRISKMVIFDVGIGMGQGLQKSRYLTLFIVVLYQWWWAFAYIVSQLVNEFLGQIIFFLYAILVPSFLVVVPLGSFHRTRHDVKVHMCYVYYQFWYDIAFHRSTMPKPKLPDCPVLFLVRSLNIVCISFYNPFPFRFLLLFYYVALYVSYSMARIKI